jgi:flagellar protein FliS
MYNAVSSRAANAYRKVSAETNVDGASPHQLIALLFDGLRQALASAEAALLRGDMAVKGAQIVRSVRFIEEGLKGGLDDAKGGDLAARLRALYDYCILRLTIANTRNDARIVAEVASLIAPVAQGWQEIGRSVAVPSI